MSGPIGDHGVTIMLARGELDIEADIVSDTAPLNGLVAALLEAAPGLRAMRDATRGGVATILNEIAPRPRTSACSSARTTSRCGPRCAAPRNCSASTRCTWPARAGWSPSWTARQADAGAGGDARAPARRRRRHHRPVIADPPGIVLLKTAFGGTRIVDLLVGDPLPRIC